MRLDRLMLKMNYMGDGTISCCFPTIICCKSGNTLRYWRLSCEARSHSARLEIQRNDDFWVAFNMRMMDYRNVQIGPGELSSCHAPEPKSGDVADAVHS
ncbi:hypothetical protein SLEP1_g28104 [Rubroshorea leprosula]|uniref:Uncharacterized protein n=1 Tax=Rubroshorea leprosula TaxID=152421 RepID=A0AAV5JZ19_9ROSI|nr:hypothetical protein SLEP1_g28104 [Rubroshorea leprosula]